MTPAEEAEFIALYHQGLTTEAIARRLGIPAGTARSRAYGLQQQGKIQPRPKGGRRVPARQEGAPSTVHPHRVDPPPSTVDRGALEMGAAVTAALQPLLTPLIARLEALEQRSRGEPLSTVHGPPSHPEPSTVHPATVDPEAWEMRQLKHSERWTVYVPRAMKDEIKRRAGAHGKHPSVYLQELLWKALNDQSSTPKSPPAPGARTPGA